MIRIFAALVLLVSSLCAAEDSSRTLTVSTWPSHADLYLGGRPSSFTEGADFETPARIEVPADSSTLRITLFKPDYTDTTLDIHLKNQGDNYITLMLQPETDLMELDKQQSILNKREKFSAGKKFLIASAVPFMVSGILAFFADREFNEAENYGDRIQNSAIRSGDNFDKLVDREASHRKSGKDLRKYAAVSLGAGALLLVTGVVLSF